MNMFDHDVTFDASHGVSNQHRMFCPTHMRQAEGADAGHHSGGAQVSGIPGPGNPAPTLPDHDRSVAGGGNGVIREPLQHGWMYWLGVLSAKTGKMDPDWEREFLQLRDEFFGALMSRA